MGVLERAKYFVDSKYKEGKGNDNIFGKYYKRNGESWCAFFVAYILEQEKFKDLDGLKAKGLHGYCPAIFNEMKAKNKIHQNPKAGDIVMFGFKLYDGKRASDHIGIVKSYDPKTKLLKTYEGNTSSDTKGSQSNGDGVS